MTYEATLEKRYYSEETLFKFPKRSFVITDIETTGPKKGYDRIIEIAAVKVQNGKVVESFESLVDPEIPIPRIISNLTGISSKMVDKQPTILNVLPKYLEFLGKDIFMAHNSSFDFNFIKSETERLGLQSISKNMRICTLKIADRLLPHVRARGLNGLAKYFNYSIHGRHRAMSDVLATKYFFDQFVRIMDQKGIKDIYQFVD